MIKRSMFMSLVGMVSMVAVPMLAQANADVPDNSRMGSSSSMSQPVGTAARPTSDTSVQGHSDRANQEQNRFNDQQGSDRARPVDRTATRAQQPRWNAVGTKRGYADTGAANAAQNAQQQPEQNRGMINQGRESQVRGGGPQGAADIRRDSRDSSGSQSMDRSSDQLNNRDSSSGQPAGLQGNQRRGASTRVMPGGTGGGPIEQPRSFDNMDRGGMNNQNSDPSMSNPVVPRGQNMNRSNDMAPQGRSGGMMDQGSQNNTGSGTGSMGGM